MQSKFHKAAVIITFFMTIVATVLRIVLTPQMQDTDTGEFRISYMIIGVLLVSIVAIIILVMLGKKPLPAAVGLDKRNRAPLAYSGMLFGSIVLISSLFESWQWMMTGETPPPNDVIINGLDRVTLCLTLLFGIVAGVFLIWMGISLAGGRMKQTSSLALAALAPVAWIWVRLVRYEVSYASAIQVAQSFYDFMMLIFTMLFLFSFARYISSMGVRSTRQLLIYALCTVLLSLSGTITKLVMYAMQEVEAYQSSCRLADFTDFGAGIFALFVAVSLTLIKPLPQEEMAAVVDDTVSETALPTPDQAVEESEAAEESKDESKDE